MAGLDPAIHESRDVDARHVKLVLGPAKGRTRGAGPDEVQGSQRKLSPDFLALEDHIGRDKEHDDASDEARHLRPDEEQALP